MTQKHGILLFLILSGILIAANHLSGKSDRPSTVSPDATYFAGTGVWVLQDGSLQTVWYSDGNKKATGNMKNHLREGEWSFWYAHGTIRATGSYLHGFRTDHWKYYHPNGKLKLEGDYKNDKRDGHWIKYYDNGIKEMEGLFANDAKNGGWTNYYENGKIFYQGHFTDNSASGEWTYYFHSGKLYQKGKYHDGIRVGKWTICISPTDPCREEYFVVSKTPARSGLAPVDQANPNLPSDTSNPARVLDALDTGPVPESVPSALSDQNGSGSWD